MSSFAITDTQVRSLAPGPHDIRIEYHARGGNASVVLKIGMEAPPPVGEIVVDDGSAGWRAEGLYADQWMPLGTHYFHAQGGENVLLSDVTYECYLCRTLVFDAVKFVPR